MKYKKITEVDAIQFTGENRTEIAEFLGASAEAWPMTKYQWIVRDSIDCYAVVPDHEFQKTYLSKQTIHDAAKSAFTRYASDRNWPTWWQYHDSIQRLKLSVETGIAPDATDVAFAALAVNQFADLQGKILGQRSELARLNKLWMGRVK